MFQTTITIGDIAVIFGLAGTAATSYFGVIRRIDRLVGRHDNLANQVDELRHGRGLVLGPTSDWPPMVRRCFGYGEK